MTAPGLTAEQRGMLLVKLAADYPWLRLPEIVANYDAQAAALEAANTAHDAWCANATDSPVVYRAMKRLSEALAAIPATPPEGEARAAERQASYDAGYDFAMSQASAPPAAVKADAVGEARAALLAIALRSDCCYGDDTEHTAEWKEARAKLEAAERAAGAK